MEVNEYYKEQAGTEETINEKTKNKILGENWENKKIRIKSGQAEIDTEVSKLKSLIDKEKELDEEKKRLETEENERKADEEKRIQTVRDKAIKFINGY